MTNPRGKPVAAASGLSKAIAGGIDELISGRCDDELAEEFSPPRS